MSWVNIFIFRFKKMLEDAVIENYVHDQSYISDSTPNLTIDAEDTMENQSDDS